MPSVKTLEKSFYGQKLQANRTYPVSIPYYDRK